MKNSEILKNFILVLLLVTIGFVAVFEIILYRLQETWPYKKVLEYQQTNDALYATRYFNQGLDYKFAGMHQAQPEVLILGTSRILQIRSSYFQDRSFYNAGIVGSVSEGLRGMKKFVSSFDKNYTPEEIIISIDPWLLNPNYPENRTGLKMKVLNAITENEFTDKMYRTYKFLKYHRMAYIAIVEEKKNILPFIVAGPAAKRIGLNAVLENTGFDRDGSYHYPKDYVDKEDQIKDIDFLTNWLKKNTYRFAPASTVDKRALERLDQILKVSQDKGIKIKGVIMPLRIDLYEALTAAKTHSVYLKDFRQHTCASFQRHGYECHDFTDPAALNLKTDDFIDKLHAKESVMDKVAVRVF